MYNTLTHTMLVMQVLRLHPRYDYAYLEIGRAKFRIGQVDAAIDAYKKAIELHPLMGIAYPHFSLFPFPFLLYAFSFSLFSYSTPLLLFSFTLYSLLSPFIPHLYIFL